MHTSLKAVPGWFPCTYLCRQVLPPLEQDHEQSPEQLQRVVVEHRAYRLRLMRQAGQPKGYSRFGPKPHEKSAARERDRQTDRQVREQTSNGGLSKQDTGQLVYNAPGYVSTARVVSEGRLLFNGKTSRREGTNPTHTKKHMAFRDMRSGPCRKK